MIHVDDVITKYNANHIKYFRLSLQPPPLPQLKTHENVTFRNDIDIKEESFNKCFFPIEFVTFYIHMYTLSDEPVKQADVVLMGFPLMINMDESTRRNDLRIYEAVSSKETILKHERYK